MTMSHGWGRSRVWRKVRFVLRMLGLLGLVIGAILAGISLLRAIDQIMTMAAVYVIGGIVLLVIWKIMDVSSKRSGSRHSPWRAGNSVASGKKGMVLVVVLLLLGLVVALVINAQVNAATALKRAQIARTRTRLRLAATDAATWFLRESSSGSKTRGAAGWSETRRMVLPAGVETEVQVLAGTNYVQSVFPVFADQSVAGSLHVVQSTASLSGRTEQVLCFVQRNDKGRIKVLAWLEE